MACSATNLIGSGGCSYQGLQTDLPGTGCKSSTLREQGKRSTAQKKHNQIDVATVLGGFAPALQLCAWVASMRFTPWMCATAAIRQAKGTKVSNTSIHAHLIGCSTPFMSPGEG